VPTVERSMLVPYTCEQMFALVIDVDRYAEFLPSCDGARALSRSDEEVCGEIDLNFKGIRHSFSTCNRLTPFERIDLSLQDGPFSTLEGYWLFQDLGAGCKVSLKLDYDFSSRLLALALGPIFSLFANGMVDAFNQRARAIYA